MTSTNTRRRSLTIGIATLGLVLAALPLATLPSAGATPKGFPKQLTGPFSGSVVSGAITLAWKGEVTLTYQRNDPILNKPWPDGVHYVASGGSYDWSVTGSQGGCTYTGSGKQAITGANFEGELYIYQPPSKKGWEWRALFGPVGVTPETHPVNQVCEPPKPSGISDASRFAGNEWDVIYNTHEGNLHPANVHSKDLVHFASNSVNAPLPTFQQTWIISLKGSGKGPRR
jgi:hypothetical protein